MERTERMPTVRRPTGPSRRAALSAAAALLILLALTGFGLVYYLSTYNGKIYPGVGAMGVDLAGKTPRQARQALLDRAAVYLQSPLTLRQGDKTWIVTPRQLGLDLDVDSLVDGAYDHGRTGSTAHQWRQRLPVANQRTQVRTRYFLDRARTVTYVQTVASDIRRAPVSSQLSLRSDGTLLASADRRGQRLDVVAATDQLYKEVARLGSDDLLLPVLAVEPSQTRDGWRNLHSLRRKAVKQSARLTIKGNIWTLGPAQLADTIVVRKGNGGVVGSFDADRLAKLLAPVAAGVRRAPEDASLKIEQGRPMLVNQKPGEALEVDQTVRSLLAALAAHRTANIYTKPVPAGVTTADLRPAKARLDSLLGSPLTLSHDGKIWTVPVSTLAEWIDVSVDRQARSASVTLKADPARQYVLSLAPEVRQEPVDADLKVERATPVIEQERAGEELDIDTTVRSMLTALSTNHQADLAMNPIPAGLTVADLQPAKSKLDALLSSPLRLGFGGRKWRVPVDTLAGWAVVNIDNQSRSASVTLDADAVGEYVANLATEIDRAPEDGELTWKRRLVVARPSVDGHTLKEGRTVAELLSLAFATDRSMDLPVRVTRPKVPTDNVASLGIKQVIGEGSSEYADSPPERIHNIHTAAGYLDNAVVAPGETFSFNDVIGPVSLDTGYQEGLTIVGDETVPGVGGGVCQVSTTTFRAAFWAGLPITERNQHSYLVPYYQQDGSPVGFDAAVYQPYSDLKWTNDTGKFILVRSHWTDSSLRIVLYGTDQGRKVRRGRPHISHVLPPLPDRTKLDRKMPRGSKEQVDWAHKGMTVSLSRTVTKSGRVLFRDAFRSKYKPWGNVYKVGPPVRHHKKHHKKHKAGR